MPSTATRCTFSPQLPLPSTNEAKSTAHNQLASPLLHLPAELRNKIYEYVFTPRTAIVPASRPSWWRPWNCAGPDNWPFSPVQACRQIRHEAKLIMLINTTFDFQDLGYGSAMKRVLELMPHDIISCSSVEQGLRGKLSNTVLAEYIRAKRMARRPRREYVIYLDRRNALKEIRAVGWEGRRILEWSESE